MTQIVHWFSMVSLVVLSLWIYRIDSRTPVVMTIDLNHIIFKAAQTFAKDNLNETQTYKRLTQFKEELERSLKDFGEKQHAIVIPKSSVYGKITDETQAFIAYYNGDDHAKS